MVRSRGGSEEAIVTTRKAMPRSLTVVSDTGTVASCSESSLLSTTTTTTSPSNRTNDSMVTIATTTETTSSNNNLSIPHCKQQKKDAIPKAISMNKTTATKTKTKTTNARKQKPKKQHPSIIHPVLSTTSLISEQTEESTEKPISSRATASTIVSVRNNDEDDVGSTLYQQLQKRLRPEDIPCIPTLERNQRRRYNPKTTTTTTTTTMSAATTFTTTNNNNYSYFRPTCTFINYFGTIAKQQQQQQYLEQYPSSTTAIPTTVTTNITTLPDSLIHAPTSAISFDVVPIPSLEVTTTTTTTDPLSFDMEYDENGDHFGLLFTISEHDPIMLQIDENEDPLDIKMLNWSMLQPEQQQQQQLEEHGRDYFWDDTFENLVPCESLIVTSSMMIEGPTTLPSAGLGSSNCNLIKKPTIPPTYSSAKMKHTDAAAMVNKIPSFVGVDEFYTTKYKTCTSDPSFTKEVSHDEDDDDVADFFNFYT